MYCKQCGTQLVESSEYCSKCGASVDVDSKKEKTNILALIGVILAGVSIFLNFWGIVGISAIVLSVIGLIQINNSNEKGKAMAITGISIGAFSVLYAFIMILLLI